jgi:hypothetical protein
MADNPKVYFNGINAVTGEYLLEPRSLKKTYSLALSDLKKGDNSILNWLAGIWHKISTPSMGLAPGVDPTDVAQAGWGIVFLKDENPAVITAMQPLIEHRRKQVNNDRIVKVLDFIPGESWEAWLGRYLVAPGSVEPTKIPYYLLLVGDPKRMTFNFGQLLDVEYGVGRLHFDTPAEYAAYTASVIDYETSTAVPNAKEAVFFGTRHNFDQATKMSADFLVKPLVEGTPAVGAEPAVPGVAEQWGFRSRSLWGSQATKVALLDVIAPQAGGASPAFLFTAGHGLGFPRGHPDQKKEQGALICQDWPGFGSINTGHYFSAADVPADAHVHGSVIFHFACYGAGTPDRDQFIHNPGMPSPQIADAPFIARLPKAWLTHPGGGALACIGHVERAWGYSIISQLGGAHIQTFQNAIGRILIGQPLGYALKDFNERYAALSTSLSSTLQQAGWGAAIDQNALAANWIQRNDAEGYTLIGDPAVKLRINDLT